MVLSPAQRPPECFRPSQAIHGACGGLPAGTPRPTAKIDEWDRLRDTEFMHRMMIPTLVSRRGGITRGELERAGRVALRRLVNACASLDQAGRARAADLLADWADNLLEPDAVDALRQGTTVSRRRPVTGANRRLRAFYRSLR